MSFAGNNYIGNNNIYVLGKDFIQGFSTDGAGHTMSEKGIYKTNMTEPNIKFVLSLHYNGDNSYFYVNGVQQLKFKSAITHADRNLLCLGNFSSDWSLKNPMQTGLFGDFYDFAVDYVPISSAKAIYDIQRYLMTKRNT